MRWSCFLCFALLLAPVYASAQTDEEDAVAASDDGTGAEPAAAPAPAPPPPQEGPREATTDDPMPSTGTSSVVVDEREERLQREQAEMLEETEEATEADVEESEETLDHEYQVGVRVGIGVPFIFALRYNDGPQCDTDGEQFCLFVGSTLINFDLSFGVTPDVEIVAGARIGAVGIEPTESNAIQLLLGIRAYISPESIAKVYLAPSIVLDVTQASPTVPDWGDVDFGVRGAFGVQVDPIRFLGIYAEVGVNILFLRSFGISPDVSGGLQVRFP